MIVTAGLHGAWLSLRTAAGEVDWGQAVRIFVGHVKRFGVSPNTSGKTLKDFNLRSNRIVFALNMLPRGTDQRGVGSGQSGCWEMVGFRDDGTSPGDKRWQLRLGGWKREP